MIEEYFIYKELERDEFLQKRLLVKFYSERRFNRLYEQEVKKIIDDFDDHRDGDLNFYMEKLFFLHERFFHPYTSKYLINEENSIELMETLDLLFIQAKLKYSCDFKNRKEILDEDYKIQFLEESENLAKSKYPGRSQWIDLYVKIFQLWDKKNEFSEVLVGKLLVECRTLFDQMQPFERGYIIQLLLNYCSRALGAGFKKFSNLSVRLYQLAIDKKILLSEEKIHNATFTNAAVCGSVAGEFEWTERFIETYKENLEENKKIDSIALAKTYLNYYLAVEKKNLKNFEKALENLRIITTSEPSFTLRIHSIGIRIFFDYYLVHDRSKNIDFLNDKLKTFEKYVKNNKTFSSQKMDRYQAFIQVVSKLTQFWLPFNKLATQDLKQLEQNISNHQSIFGKYWLIEKVRELRTEFPHLRL